MKIKTNELTGAALDWAVAKCAEEWSDEDALLWVQDDEYQYAPSTDWSQGGPIIEREAITLDYDAYDTDKMWQARRYAFDGTLLHNEYGPTPLIAVMRCYCASKLGDEIEIPEELK